MIRLLLLALAGWLLTPPARAAEPTSQPTPLRDTWHDADRDRDVPVLIYLPAGSGPAPAIIFSHGLGGSRDGYSYLGKYWSQHGYISVHLQHLGSDTAVLHGDGDLKQRMQQVAIDPRNAVNRVKDVSFAIDQLALLDNDTISPLHNRVDFAHLGIAGHSFGGHTTMAISGQLSRSGRSYVDNRITAAVVMSPPSPAGHANADALEPVHVPVFEFTGTLDDSPVGDTKAADRRFNFDHLVHAPAYLAIFNDGDHMLFSGREYQGRNVPRDDRYHLLIQKTTTLFWDAYLRGDEKAKAAFADGTVKMMFGDAATFEEKAGDGQVAAH